MHVVTLLAQLAAETEEHSGNAALETIWFPIIAIATFAFLALVTFTYRDVANRHAAKAEAYARTHGGAHGATHGEDAHGTGDGH